MTDFIYRITAICPSAVRSHMQVISEALGYGRNTFTVPLSPTGEEPATHYASSTVARQDFHDMLTDRGTQDTVLESIDWAQWGFSGEDEVRLILRAQKDTDPPIMVIGGAGERASDQLAILMAVHGLQRVSSVNGVQATEGNE